MKFPKIEKKNAEDVGRTLKVTDGGLTAEVVNGEEAVQQWLNVMLRQRPGLTHVYDYDDADLGVDSVGVASQPKAVMLAEIKRNITETADKCSGIRSVSDFNFKRSRGTLKTSFTANLSDTQESEVIEIDV